MIKLSLDKFDFLCAVEGFARGSHLRQHVWEQIVYKSIPQMSKEDINFLWYFMRRDLWNCYFYEINGKKHTRFGYEDFIHALAVLHLGNRYRVCFKEGVNNKPKEALCYRFDGKYRPIYLYNDKNNLETELQPFNCYIPSVYIKKVEHEGLSKNGYVSLNEESWWSDLEIYDNFEKKLL